jgi:hypothetical protein
MGATESMGSASHSLEATESMLEAICQRHYGMPLTKLLSNVETPKGRRQYARLLGVLLKEPFANEFNRPPVASTGAMIGLRWKDDNELRAAAVGTWQFDFMRELLVEHRGQPVSEDEAFGQLTYYKYESSIGKFIFEAFRDRICGDEKTSKAVREAIAAAKKAGVKLTEPTTAHISVGAASVVAVAVASRMSPTLAAVGAPVIGGVALLLIQIGVDGFCRWSRAVIEGNDPTDNSSNSK